MPLFLGSPCSCLMICRSSLLCPSLYTLPRSHGSSSEGLRTSDVSSPSSVLLQTLAHWSNPALLPLFLCLLCVLPTCELCCIFGLSPITSSQTQLTILQMCWNRMKDGCGPWLFLGLILPLSCDLFLAALWGNSVGFIIPIGRLENWGCDLIIQLISIRITIRLSKPEQSQLPVAPSQLHPHLPVSIHPSPVEGLRKNHLCSLISVCVYILQKEWTNLLDVLFILFLEH